MKINVLMASLALMAIGCTHQINNKMEEQITADNLTQEWDKTFAHYCQFL